METYFAMEENNVKSTSISSNSPENTRADHFSTLQRIALALAQAEIRRL